MRLKRSKLSARHAQRLCEHFVAGTLARTAAELVGVNRSTAILFYHRLRELIAAHVQDEHPIDGVVELDERQRPPERWLLSIGVDTRSGHAAKQSASTFALFFASPVIDGEDATCCRVSLVGGRIARADGGVATSLSKSLPAISNARKIACLRIA
ncbi:MAG: hypothetical protein ABIY40_07085 [Rhodanobacteraceae bacterium]